MPPTLFTVTHSANITIQKFIKLWRHFYSRAQSGGIHLTNDFGPKYPALEIVMKLVRCNERPVAKLSDSPGKTIRDDVIFLAYLRSVFNVPAEPGPSGAGAAGALLEGQRKLHG